MHDTLIQLGLIEEDDIQLDDAALTLAAVDHAGIDLEPYGDLLGQIAERLADVGEEPRSNAQRAACLAEVIADEYGFAGDRETYDDPDNADLIRVLDRRRGLPVSLSILYVSAARRIGWTAHALDVPGHVLVLIGGDVSPVIVDPFRGGAIVQPDELVTLVSASSSPETPVVRHVSTMPNRAVLVRLLMNQATRAEGSGLGRRALTLFERMTAFAPSYGQAWWERARLELVDGRVEDARMSLTAMLEVTREPDLRARIGSMLSALAG